MTRAHSDNISLYKYVKKDHAVAFLDSGELKLATLHDLNDPYEAAVAPFPSLCPPRNIYHVRVREGESQTLFNMMRDKYALLCMSATVTDPVLWSHYADAHHGIALEFTFTRTQRNLLRIDYSNERLSLDDLQINKNDEESTLRKIISRKYASWAYENEYRLFFKIEQTSAKGGMFFMYVGFGRLTKVILGVRCDLSPSYVRQSLQKKVAATPVARACLSKTAYALTIDETLSQ